MTAEGHSIHIKCGCQARRHLTARLTARVNLATILRRGSQSGFTRAKLDTCRGQYLLQRGDAWTFKRLFGDHKKPFSERSSREKVERTRVCSTSDDREGTSQMPET